MAVSTPVLIGTSIASGAASGGVGALIDATTSGKKKSTKGNKMVAKPLLSPRDEKVDVGSYAATTMGKRRKKRSTRGRTGNLIIPKGYLGRMTNTKGKKSTKGVIPSYIAL
jgi:hypothetical protein